MRSDDEIARLTAMIDEIRRLRESCEPKTNDNRRYHAYSAAVSNLNRIIDDIRQEEGPAGA